MSDAIGAMRAFVQMQSPTRVADELGGSAIAWTDEGEVWAAIEAGGASFGPAFDTAQSVASYRITVNRAGVRAGWRVVWRARVFRVLGVSDDGAPRIMLACEEEIL